MNKIIICLLILIVAPSTIFSQGIKIQLQGGLGSYSMSDLKAFDNMVVNQIPLPLEQTANFPPYWYFKGAILFNINQNISFGPMYSYNSTGSRYSLSDYSGVFYYDDLVQAHSVGLSLNYSKEINNTLRLCAYLDGGMSLTKVEFKDYLQLNEIEEPQTSNYFAKETGLFIEPGFKLGYPIKWFEPGLSIGYNILIAAKGLKEESEEYLYLQNGEKINANWNGLRIALIVTVPLGKKN